MDHYHSWVHNLHSLNLQEQLISKSLILNEGKDIKYVNSIDLDANIFDDIKYSFSILEFNDTFDL